MSSEFDAKLAKSSIVPSFVDADKVSKGQSSRLNFQRATSARSSRYQKAMIK